MTPILIPAVLPDGRRFAGHQVRIALVTGDRRPGFTGETHVMGTATHEMPRDGDLTVGLVPNAGLMAGSLYDVEIVDASMPGKPASWRLRIQVPDEPGPEDGGAWMVGDPVLIVPPGAPGVSWEPGPPGWGVQDLPELAAGVGTVVDGSDPEWLRVDRSLLRCPGKAPVANTTAETTLMAATRAWPAGALGDGEGQVAVSGLIAGEIVNSTGSPADVTIRVRYDGVVVAAATIAVPTGATARQVAVELDHTLVEFSGLRTIGQVTWRLSAAGGGAVAVHGMAAAAVSLVDPDAPIPVDVTVQHSVASAQLSTATPLMLFRRSLMGSS